RLAQSPAALIGESLSSLPETGPKVIPRVVNVLTARLLRAWRRSLCVDVGSEKMLRADEFPGRKFEDKDLIRGCPVSETRRSRERRKADAGWRTDHQRRIDTRLNARPAGVRQLTRRDAIRAACHCRHAEYDSQARSHQQRTHREALRQSHGSYLSGYGRAPSARHLNSTLASIAMNVALSAGSVAA